MKNVILFCFVLALTAPSAFAVPGSSSLACQSSAGAKQSLKLAITRIDAIDTANAIISISVDGKDYPIATPDISKNYGQTIKDASLGVIVATVDVQPATGTVFGAQIMAVPGSVKAYDQKGNPKKWNLQGENFCEDGDGHATFQGVISNGILNVAPDANSAPSQYIQLDPQIMDCTITYNTGSAC